MKLKSLSFLITLLALVGCTTAQISQAEAVGASLVPLVQQGTVLAADAYAVYQSGNQNLTSANVIQGKLSVSKVLAGAQAILGSSSTSQASQSLLTAANTFTSDINSSIAAYKAARATTNATIAAVSSSGAATVTSIAAVAPAAPATSYSPLTPIDLKEEKKLVAAAEFKVRADLRSPLGEHDAYHVLLAQK